MLQDFRGLIRSCLLRTLDWIKLRLQSRKIILCALAIQDYAAARTVFNQMSESARAQPMTRHLMYKVALREQDSDLGWSPYPMFPSIHAPCPIDPLLSIFCHQLLNQSSSIRMSRHNNPENRERRQSPPRLRSGSTAIRR